MAARQCGGRFRFAQQIVSFRIGRWGELCADTKVSHFSTTHTCVRCSSSSSRSRTRTTDRDFQWHENKDYGVSSLSVATHKPLAPVPSTSSFVAAPNVIFSNRTNEYLGIRLRDKISTPTTSTTTQREHNVAPVSELDLLNESTSNADVVELKLADVAATDSHDEQPNIDVNNVASSLPASSSSGVSNLDEIVVKKTAAQRTANIWWNSTQIDDILLSHYQSMCECDTVCLIRPAYATAITFVDQLLAMNKRVVICDTHKTRIRTWQKTHPASRSLRYVQGDFHRMMPMQARKSDFFKTLLLGDKNSSADQQQLPYELSADNTSTAQPPRFSIICFGDGHYAQERSLLYSMAPAFISHLVHDDTDRSMYRWGHVEIMLFATANTAALLTGAKVVRSRKEGAVWMSLLEKLFKIDVIAPAFNQNCFTESIRPQVYVKQLQKADFHMDALYQISIRLNSTIQIGSLTIDSNDRRQTLDLAKYFFFLRRFYAQRKATTLATILHDAFNLDPDTVRDNLADVSRMLEKPMSMLTCAQVDEIFVDAIRSLLLDPKELRSTDDRLNEAFIDFYYKSVSSMH